MKRVASAVPVSVSYTHLDVYKRQRQQAAQLRLVSAERGMLVSDSEGGPPEYVSPLKGKPAPAFALEDLSGAKVALSSRCV